MLIRIVKMTFREDSSETFREFTTSIQWFGDKPEAWSVESLEA